MANKHSSASVAAAASTDKGSALGDIGALSQAELIGLLEALRSETSSEHLKFPPELWPLVLQVKRDEANFLGPRLHCTEPDTNRDFLLEEDILGYGFVDKSKLEDVMLSFLNVLCGCDANEGEGNPFASANIFRYQGQPLPPNPEHLSKTWYVRNFQILLRRLILNNPYVAYVRQLNNLSSEEKWTKWQELFIAGNAPVDKDKEQDLGYTEADLEYLRDPQLFASFDDFAQKVTLLQNWVLQRPDQDRAWYLTFLFPHGPAFLFTELEKRLTTSTNYLAYVAFTLFAFLERAGRAKPDTMLDLGGGVSATVKEVQKSVGRELKRRFCDHSSPLNLLARDLAGSSYYIALAAQLELCKPAYYQVDLAPTPDAQEQKPYLNENSFIDACKAQAKAWGATIGEASTLKSVKESRFILSTTPYCPVLEHRIFSQLLEDFGRLLKMDINNQELFHALGQMAVLNMMVYGLEQSRGALRVGKGDKGALSADKDDKDALKVGKDDRDINIIPVLNLSSRDSGIRRSSVQRCASNNALNTDMLEPYMRAHLQRLVALVDPELMQQSKLKASHINELFALVAALFSFHARSLNYLKQECLSLLQNKSEKFSRRNRQASKAKIETSKFEKLAISSQELIDAIFKAMLSHGRSCAGYHWAFGESIGLISTEITRGHCYCLSDALLRTLVMTVVGCSDHMELSSFLDSLEQRYHIVIGPKQARVYYSEGAPFASDLNMRNLDDEFAKNLQGLKAQLSRLGLLRELSDSCEYVHNPFYQEQQQQRSES